MSGVHFYSSLKFELVFGRIQYLRALSLDQGVNKSYKITSIDHTKEKMRIMGQATEHRDKLLGTILEEHVIARIK